MLCSTIRTAPHDSDLPGPLPLTYLDLSSYSQELNSKETEIL